MYKITRQTNRRFSSGNGLRNGNLCAGVTAIELLVVVAIISLLVSILLPSMRRAREQARLVKCQSNLRSLAFGWHLYWDDHGGRFLRGKNAVINYGGRQGDDRGPRGDRKTFLGSKPLNPYVGLPEIVEGDCPLFTCPSDRGFQKKNIPAYKSRGTSYYMNRLLGGQNKVNVSWASDSCKKAITDLNDSLPGLKRSMITAQSNLLLMGDYEWDITLTSSPAFRNEFAPSWHGKPCHYNMAFMDGHADFVRIRKGIFVDSKYTVIPLKNLRTTFANCQEEIPCPELKRN